MSKLSSLYEEKPTGFRTMNWVMNDTHPKMKKNNKLVAVQLASHINQKTGTAYPSLKTLAEETGLSKSTVRKAIKAIIDLDKWEIKEPGNNRRADGGNSSNVYFPHIPKSLPKKPSTQLDKTTQQEEN